MSTHKQIPGKFSWFELVSSDAKKAQAFYGEVLGWKTVSHPMGNGSYDMVYAGDAMIGGYAPASAAGAPSRWIACASVEDVDASAKAAAALGGTVIVAPFDARGVGRRAHIADAQGAELYLLKSATGDAPDAELLGGWCWNELHTSDPAAALAFYEKVIGFTHRSVDMGPAGTYHILSKAGVDRGGVTHHLDGKRPLWLPYVHVDDVDATLARIPKFGGVVMIGPADIPGTGRFGVFQDPTGAALAILKPLPTEKPRS